MVIIWGNVLTGSVLTKRIPSWQYMSLEIYMRHWKRQCHECSLWTPCQLLGNEPWAWNTFLLREEPKQPVLGLSSYVGMGHTVQSPWAIPLLNLFLEENRRGFLPLPCGEGGMCLGWLPCVGLPLPRDPLAVGNPCPLLKQISLCLFFVWVKYCQISRCSGWKCLESTPGTGSRYLVPCLTLRLNELIREYRVYYWQLSKAEPRILLLPYTSESPEALIKNRFLDFPFRVSISGVWGGT